MSSRPKPGPLLIALAYVGFVSLGLPDAVVGVAWPSVRETFGLPQSALGLAFLGAGAGYFASSFFSGRLVHALGIGLLLAASSALVAASGFGFAVAPFWAAFVACSVLHGLGSGAIDAGLNGYAAANLSARHMNWLHACYCLGAMLGPLLMTGVLTAGGSYRTGYASIGGVMLAMAVLFAATRPRWGMAAGADGTAAPAGMVATLRHPTVLLQMAVFFMYTGLEVTVSQWAYTLLTESRNVPEELAGVWAGVYWGSIGVGRVLAGVVADRVGIDRLLRFAMLAALSGTLLLAVPSPTPVALAGIVLIGLGLAPVYPCLMTRTPQRLGSGLAAHAVGFQVGTAMVGAAVLPAGVGVTAQAAGLEAIAYQAVGMAVVLWVLHEVLLRGGQSRGADDQHPLPGPAVGGG